MTKAVLSIKTMDKDNLINRICQLTVPSSDDGKSFINRQRYEIIKSIIESLPYICISDQPLSFIYAKKHFQSLRPFILISTHIDSIYKKYFFSSDNKEINGCFDNSATNAILVELMKENLIPDQVIIAFTGNEEDGFKGVNQTINFLKEDMKNFDKLEMVIVLDLTEESYNQHSFTFENLFIKKNNHNSILKFNKKREMKSYIEGLLKSSELSFIIEAVVDESWRYNKNDLNIFSFCLPCRLLGNSMHSGKGVVIRKDDIFSYATTLSLLLKCINESIQVNI